MTNKKNLLRILSLLLITSMLMTACVSFVSCANGTGNNTQGNDTKVEGSSSEGSDDTNNGEGESQTETDDIGTSGGEDSSSDESESETENIPEDSNTEEATTEEYTGDAYTYAEVGDIIITKVYGNDGNVDAPVKSSFIELYNTTDKNLSLGEFSIYYGKGKSFSRLKFSEHTIIAPSSFFLIKCNAFRSIF